MVRRPLLLALALTIGQMLIASPRVKADTNDIINLLTWRSEIHGANPNLVIAIARCESSLNPYAPSRDGTYGLGQWKGGRAAWRRTPAWTKLGIDIVHEYQINDPDAPYYDADELAWAFSPEAPYNLRYEWACYWRLDY